MFSVHTTLGKFENSAITGHLCLRKTRAGESRDYHDVIVFEKLSFRDGIVWTVDLTVEVKLRFQIHPA